MKITDRYIFQRAITNADAELRRVAWDADDRTGKRIDEILRKLAHATYKVWRLEKVKR